MPTALNVEFTLFLGNSQLTLITDGVVEARNKAGEFFRFDRAVVIASDSAESIAQAAQEFGQEDDIAVVTVLRQRVEASADIAVSPPHSSL